LVRLIDRAFGRAETRLASAAAALASLVEDLSPPAGVLWEADLRRRLGLSGADDLRAVHTGADLSWPDQWRWLPGTGLCHETWLAAIRAVCERELAGVNGEGAALERLKAAVAASDLPQASPAADHVEALLPRLGFEVAWLSLFEAVVRRRGGSG
jgi:hypothetical protein